MVGAVVLLLLIAGGLAWWKYRPGCCAGTSGTAESASGEGAAGAPKATKDSIILADFVNHTGDPVFDTTLNQALKIELEQSPVINIVSEQHLEQSVKFLGKPEGTPVTPQIAREIGEREGMKAIITGTIANLGKEYVISLTAQNTATGDEIVSEQARAADKDHVLDALSNAAKAMRSNWARISKASRDWTLPLARQRRPRWRRFVPMPWVTRRTIRGSTFLMRRATTSAPWNWIPTLPWLMHGWGWCTAIQVRWRKPTRILPVPMNSQNM